MSEPPPDRRIPAYLGRVLDADGEPAGTCFQLAPAIVATAWHVLNAVGAGALDAEVSIDPLAGGEPQAGTVVAVDPPADLGTLAARRGDLTEAETHYGRSLDIKQQLGNQAGVARSISALGFLTADRGQIEHAIGLHGRALLIRAGMGIPEAEFDVRKLLELRRRVAPEVFLGALAAVAGDDQAAEIVRALDAREGAGGSTE